MRIIGFGLKKILAEKKDHVKGKIEIKSNINIDNIQEEKISISEKLSLKFDFTFSIEYSESAKIELKGTIGVLDDQDEAKDILKEWKKKKFTHPIKILLFNFILDKCNLKALQLEEEIGLPYHIPMPKLANNTNQEPKNSNPANYAG